MFHHVQLDGFLLQSKQIVFVGQNLKAKQTVFCWTEAVHSLTILHERNLLNLIGL